MRIRITQIGEQTPKQNDTPLDLAIIADGNQRFAEREQIKPAKTYDNAGEHVIKLAEQILSSQLTINSLVFYILSAENIQNREPEFMHKMWLAFIALGSRISRGKSLENIGLSVHGNTKLIKNQPGGPDLAQAIDATLAISKAKTTKPDAILTLGIGYNAQSLHQLHEKNTQSTSLLVRSGMELPNTFRSSGLAIPQQTICYGTTRLFPELTLSNITTIASSIPAALFRPFTPEETKAIEDIITIIKRYHGPNLEITLASSTQEADWHVTPGQTGPYFQLPTDTSLAYANIHGSEYNDPTSIAETIRTILEKQTAIPNLRGATRPKSSPIVEELAFNPKETPEFKRYFSEPENNKESTEFDHLADRFVHNMLDWATSTLEIEWDSPNQFRAATNYCLTSFFLVYEPNNPKTIKQAENIAQYMLLVFFMDNQIFDNPQATANALLTTIASNSLTESMNSETNTSSSDILPPIVYYLSEGFASLREELEKTGTKSTTRRWRKAMIALFKSHEAETNLKFAQKHKSSKTKMANAPSIIRKKYKTAKYNLHNHPPDNQSVYATEIYFFRYLNNISESIGAALAYRTLAACSEPESDDPELNKLYEECCSLLNFFFRIANDLAEIQRMPEERENKISSLTYLTKIQRIQNPNISNPAQISIYALNEGKALAEELWQEFESNSAKLIELAERSNNKYWLQMGLAMQRSKIALKIYQDNHYDKITRPEMQRICRELRPELYNA